MTFSRVRCFLRIIFAFIGLVQRKLVIRFWVSAVNKNLVFADGKNKLNIVFRVSLNFLLSSLRTSPHRRLKSLVDASEKLKVQ